MQLLSYLHGAGLCKSVLQLCKEGLLMKKDKGKKISSVQKTKRLTVSALLCALGACMLCAGRLFDGSLDLSMAALASLLCVWAAEELGGPYPWLMWLVTSLLAIMLLPFNSAADLFQ